MVAAFFSSFIIRIVIFLRFKKFGLLPDAIRRMNPLVMGDTLFISLYKARSAIGGVDLALVVFYFYINIFCVVSLFGVTLYFVSIFRDL